MDFPAFVPSSRNYNLGDYAVRTFRAQSGAESRILYGDSRFGTTLELQYQNIADKNAETFMVHYENMKGTFKTFPITAGVMGGWDGLAFPDGFPYKNQRNSDATYIDQEGIIRTAGPNETRINYDLNGNSTGFLLEGEATNLLPDTSGAQPPWAGAAISVPLSNVTAPDGTNTNVFRSEFTNGGGVVLQFDPPSTDSCTFSFFSKPDPVNNPAGACILEVLGREPGQPFSSVCLAFFSYTDNNPLIRSTNPVLFNAKRQSLANNWFRFSCVISGLSVYEKLRFDCESRLNLNVGNNTEQCFPTYWGPQAEAGTEVTSFIPTYGTPVTRAADKLAALGAWRYAEPPDITSVRPGVSSARVRLISVV